jgi:hypothetical protein
MPFDEADETDPLELVGVELPADEAAMIEQATVFAEEFARMGFSEEKLMQLFKNPFYAGAHGAYRALGEEKVRELVQASARIWGGIRFHDSIADPASGSAPFRMENH